MQWQLGRVTPEGTTKVSAGVITILAGSTQLVETAVFSAAAGDFFHIFGRALALKGGVAGDVTLEIQAVGLSGDYDGPLFEAISLTAPLNATWMRQVWMIQRCMTAGTIKFRLNCTSAGSNSTMQPEQGIITVIDYAQNT